MLTITQHDKIVAWPIFKKIIMWCSMDSSDELLKVIAFIGVTAELLSP